MRGLVSQSDKVTSRRTQMDSFQAEANSVQTTTSNRRSEEIEIEIETV